MQHAKPRVKCVYRGHPHKATPLDLPTSTVDDDVNATHVANLPLEELYKVQKLGYSRKKEPPIKGLTSFLERMSMVTEAQASQHPVSHAEPAVDESLNVDAEHLWVQLSTPAKVLQEAACSATIRRRGKVESLEVEEHGKQHPKDVEASNTSRENFEHNPEIIPPIYWPYHGSDAAFLSTQLDKSCENNAATRD